MSKTIDIRENDNNLTTEEIATLWRAVGWNWYEADDGYARTAESLNDKRCTTFLAYTNDKLVGLAHAMDNGFTAYLCYLVVIPEYQRQGIGKALLTAFDNKFFEYHRHMLADNDAVGFYRANGYGHDEEYTAMAKWACEKTSPQIGSNDWSQSEYAATRSERGHI